MSADKWFEQAEDVPEDVPTGGNQPVFFDIGKVGDSVEVTFLDPDPNEDEGVGRPPILNVHKVFGLNDGEKFPSYVLCARTLKESCGICDHCDTLDKEDKEQKKEYGSLRMKKCRPYSVLVATGKLDSNDNPYPPSKQIRLTQESQKKAIDSRVKKLQAAGKGQLKNVNGLCGHTFTISRPDEDFVPRIGNIDDYLETPDLLKMHEDPTPFSRAELVKKFVTDKSVIDAYVTRELTTPEAFVGAGSGQSRKRN